MSLSASAWNRLVKEAGRIWPMRFEFEEAGLPPPQHPWAVTPGFDERGRFGLRVRAGFVNGSPAYILTTFSDAPPATQDRLVREAREAGRPRPKEGDRVQSYLYEGPFLRPNWRPVDPSNPNLVLPPLLSPYNTRRDANLVATELVIETFRTYSFAVAEYSLTDLNIAVEINVGYRIIDSPGFELTTYANFLPPSYEFSPRDVFFNQYSEQPLQQIKIATLYALRTSRDVIPRPDWRFGADYDTYYNLGFSEMALPPAQQSRPISFVTPLGLGLANAPAFLASNNQAAAEVIAYLARRRTGGFFHVI